MDRKTHKGNRTNPSLLGIKIVTSACVFVIDSSTQEDSKMHMHDQDLKK